MSICDECMEAESKVVIAVDYIEVDDETRWLCSACFENHNHKLCKPNAVTIAAIKEFEQ